MICFVLKVDFIEIKQERLEHHSPQPYDNNGDNIQEFYNSALIEDLSSNSAVWVVFCNFHF